MRAAQPDASKSVRKKSGSKLATVLLMLLVLGAVAFVGGSAVFVYQQSRLLGFPVLGGPEQLQQLLGGGPATGGQFAHQNGPCSSCHSSGNDRAKLYLAIDGQDVTDNPSVTVKAGEAFEVAFHFEAARGGGHSGVGVEVIVPGTSAWSIGPGTGKAVQGWSAKGSGRTFWSQEWSRADAGNSSKGGTWKRVSGPQRAFYLDYTGTRWAMPGIAAAAVDDGSAADPDGRSDAMGGDFLLSVPLNGQPGKYELAVAAIGNDWLGRPAQTERRITVQVEPAPPRAGAKQRVYYKSSDHGGKLACGSCHPALHKAPASHQGLGNDQCTQCHTTTVSGPAKPLPSPAIPHAVAGRENCLYCHSQDGLKPTPADHGGRSGATCTLCHRQAGDPRAKPAQIPHPLDDRKDCASCHGSDVIPVVPADHERRGNDMCTICHAGADIKPTAPAPAVPHATDGGRADCLTCHARGMLGPVPQTHSGFAVDDSNCAGCHKPLLQVSVPGRAPNTPHAVDGRSDCTACHGPAGLRPAPADHAGRPSATCTGCHTPGIDRSGTAPRTPHPVDGRESCLTCHSGPMIPLVPADHSGRTNDSCLSCHSAPKA